MVIAAHRIGQHFPGDHPHLDAVAIGQALATGDGEALWLGLELRGDRFAGLIELGEEVALALDVVSHPVGRRQRLTVGALLGPGQRTELGQPAAVGEGAIKPYDRVGDARRVLGDLGHLMAGDGEVLEQRIGEHLGQVARAGRFLIRREAADVDVIDLGQPQQDLRGHRPLVAFQVVEVAGRDAEVFRHPGLGEAEVAAQPPQTRAEKQLPLGDLGHRSHFVTTSQM